MLRRLVRNYEKVYMTAVLLQWLDATSVAKKTWHFSYLQVREFVHCPQWPFLLESMFLCWCFNLAIVDHFFLVFRSLLTIKERLVIYVHFPGCRSYSRSHGYNQCRQVYQNGRELPTDRWVFLLGHYCQLKDILTLIKMSATGCGISQRHLTL